MLATDRVHLLLTVLDSCMAFRISSAMPGLSATHTRREQETGSKGGFDIGGMGLSQPFSVVCGNRLQAPIEHHVSSAPIGWLVPSLQVGWVGIIAGIILTHFI